MQNKILILIIFLSSFIVYSNTYKNSFLYGDDEEIVLRNQYIKSWKFLPKLFTENYKAGSGVQSNYYRPFQILLYTIILTTIGLKLWPFHFVSIFFHALCGVSIFLLLNKIFEISENKQSAKKFEKKKNLMPVIPALISIIWSVHPIHAEEIGPATGVASPLYFFFILLALLSFIKYLETNKKQFYLLSIISFVGGLLSKESSIIFPVLVLGLHITINKLKSQNTDLKKLINIHLTYWLVLAIYLFLRLTYLNFGGTLNFYKTSNIFTENFLVRLYTFFTVISYGLKLIILPSNLHPERSWPIFVNFLSWQVLISFFIILILIFIAIYRWKKEPIISFGIFWFFVSYFPMSNLVARINAVFWEHWLYVPSFGILIAICSFFYNRKKLKTIFIFLACIGIFTFAIYTYSRNYNFSDPLTYYGYILKYEPGISKIWNNYAMALSEKGKFKEAIECYKKAIQISDEYPHTHHNLGNSYLEIGRPDLAEEEFKKAIQMDPNFYHSYVALARIYAMKNDIQQAKKYFDEAVKIYPYLVQKR